MQRERRYTQRAVSVHDRNLGTRKKHGHYLQRYGREGNKIKSQHTANSLLLQIDAKKQNILVVSLNKSS